MIAGNLRRLPKSEQINRLRRERQERAETGHWKVFRLPEQPDQHNLLVRNLDSGSIYRVAWEPSADRASCTCEDFRNTCRRLGILCKHIEAVKINARSHDEQAAVTLSGKVVAKDGRYTVSLEAGNGRIINYHLRHGCSCFMKTFCYRTGQKCFHSAMLDRWIEAGLVPVETLLDAPVIRERVVALPADRPWDEWRVYGGALSRTWSVLPSGSRAFVVDNGGRDVPHQVVLADSEGACSCGRFYQTGACVHVDLARDALRRRTVLRPRSAGKPSRSRGKSRTALPSIS